MAARVLCSVLVLLSCLYVALVALIYFSQQRLEYPGTRTTPAIDRPAPAGWSTVILPMPGSTASGDTLTLWQARPARPATPTVVLFHGNEMGTTDLFPLAEALRRQGYGAILAAYRGYSGNAGSPSEQNLRADGQAAFDLAARDGPVILFGHSLGAGVATELAAANPQIGALILSAPFTSAAEIVSRKLPFIPVRWLMRDRYELLKIVPGITCPVLIIHGDADRVVPLSEGHRLAEALGSHARLTIMEGSDHNSIWVDGQDAIQQFIAELFPAPAALPLPEPAPKKKPRHLRRSPAAPPM